jgi:hypothetical protein
LPTPPFEAVRRKVAPARRVKVEQRSFVFDDFDIFRRGLRRNRRAA